MRFESDSSLLRAVLIVVPREASAGARVVRNARFRLDTTRFQPDTTISRREGWFDRARRAASTAANGYSFGASQSLHGRLAPSFSALPSGVITHGRLIHGGLWRTC